MKNRIQQLLVIGLDHYQSPAFDPLDNAVSDAREVINCLQTRYGVELATEPLWNAAATKTNIYAAFTQLLASLGDQDDLIVYFAGHGRQHTLIGSGYWMPYDATDDVASYISNSEIKDFLGGMKAHHILLITDACFSGTFISRTRGTIRDQSYESLDGSLSRWVLTSGGEEAVSDGAKGGTSPFAKYLLRYLNGNTNAWTSVAEVCRYVTILTGDNAKQRPQAARIEGIGDDCGELVLRLKEQYVQTRQQVSSSEPPTLALRQELRAIIGTHNKIATGKEIILVESIFSEKEKRDLIVMELFRFDDGGRKKVEFEEEKLLMPGIDGALAWPLIQRFATWTGFYRYWDREKEKYTDREVHSWPADEQIGDVEDTDAVLRHKLLLDDLYKKNPSFSRCLHCGNPIDRQERILVEIDEVGLRPNLGNVHPDCLRPADRILGTADLPAEYGVKGLIDFDVDKWIEALPRGQGLMVDSKRIAAEKGVATIVWNRENIDNLGEYCIRLYLEGGSPQMLYLGSRIQRFFRGVIDKEVETFNGLIQDAWEKGEAWAYSSEQRLFDTVSRLEGRKYPSEQILRVVKAEKIRYSSQMEPETRIENDYAPLCLLTAPDTGQIAGLSGIVPLISDPVQFEDLRQNWHKAGYLVEECVARILASDKELDLILNECWVDGLQPVIDPQFDREANLTGGMPVVKMRDIVEQREKQSGTPVPDSDWKAGDRVEIVFPGHETDPHPTGILVTGELIDDEGNRFVIFSAVEDGVVRDDLRFRINPELLRRPSEDVP